ncbi:hypothetical protein PVK06_017007 [Gossypium arboreum]|uniref:DUF7745 domain-containing protein n=1 Tax=Gossypium arboreum TaxID=29729 RepID=A0ABR0Q2C8_GOSAR|nr:hypothetical protein PVK06_017007 [Gossypium arboreum]
MTVVVTPLSGSEKLRLREVFASVQDSGSLSGYIRTYGIDSRPISKLEIFIMENGLLDRVEGNANVHRWSEQTQLGKVDSITVGYMSELSDYTRISVTQNNLLMRTCFELSLSFGTQHAAVLPLGRIKEKGESKCILWGALKDLIQTHLDEVKRVDIFALSLYGLMVFPKALGYVDKATTNLFHRLSKRVTPVPTILAETFRSLNACKRASAGSFDWVPLLGIWGAISYAPLLVLRQHGLRQFIPATYGLVQSEFMYRGADYKRKVSEISSACNKTCRLKGVVISSATTPEYVEWRGRRINDNIPKPSVERARPIEKYLQVMPLELEIMKQEFERKNLELEKRIGKLEEEKMYLSLDVDVQKMEVKKERKEKRKIKEDQDDLKEHYKKAQKEVQEEKAKAEYWERMFQEMQSQNLELEEENKGLKTKVTELGRSLHWHRNHDPTVELNELKSKVEDLEVALHDGELRIEQLKAREDYLKGELHHMSEKGITSLVKP